MMYIEIIRDNWILITFSFSCLSTFLVSVFLIIEGIKCSLRNDILTIYDRCKDKKKITFYELEAIMKSYTIYKLLKGNSFVKEIVERVKEFELID